MQKHPLRLGKSRCLHSCEFLTVARSKANIKSKSKANDVWNGRHHASWKAHRGMEQTVMRACLDVSYLYAQIESLCRCVSCRGPSRHYTPLASALQEGKIMICSCCAGWRNGRDVQVSSTAIQWNDWRRHVRLCWRVACCLCRFVSRLQIPDCRLPVKLL